MLKSILRLEYNTRLIGYRIRLLGSTYDVSSVLCSNLALDNLVSATENLILRDNRLVSESELNSSLEFTELDSKEALGHIINTYKQLDLLNSSELDVIIEDSASGRDFYIKMLEKYKGDLTLNCSRECRGFKDVIKALKRPRSTFILLIFDFALEVREKIKIMTKIQKLIESGHVVFYFTPQCFEEVLLSYSKLATHSDLCIEISNYVSSGTDYSLNNRLQYSTDGKKVVSKYVLNSKVICSSNNLENMLAHELHHLVNTTDLRVTKGKVSDKWFEVLNSSNSLLGGLVNLLSVISNRSETSLPSWTDSAKNRLYGGVFYV